MKAGVSKQQFIEALEDVLKLTREEVNHLVLQDQDTVIIYYESGGSKRVNIALDSGIAIIRDVVKNI